MANYATLKSAIEQVIKTNGNNEITGALLQQSLLAMINTLGAGYQFVGIATPTTNPGTPDYNVFYIASTAGTYSNFNGLIVNDGEIAILKYNGTWTKDVTGAATAEKVTQLDQDISGFDFSNSSSRTYYRSDGTPQTGAYRYRTIPIPVVEGMKVECVVDSTDTNLCSVAAFKSGVFSADDSIIGTGALDSFTYIVPAGVTEIVVCSRYLDSAYVSVVGSTQHKFEVLQSSIERNNDIVSIVDFKNTNDRKYYNADGTSSTNAYRYRTKPLAVKAGDKIAYSCWNNSSIFMVAALRNGVISIADSLPGTGNKVTSTYTVPDGITEVVFCTWTADDGAYAYFEGTVQQQLYKDVPDSFMKKADINVKWFIDPASPYINDLEEIYIPPKLLEGIDVVNLRAPASGQVYASAHYNGNVVWIARIWSAAQDGIIQVLPCTTAGGNANLGDPCVYLKFKNAAHFDANPAASYNTNRNIVLNYVGNLRFSPNVSYYLNKELEAADVSIALPPTIYAVVGDNLQLFHKSIVKAVNYKNYSIVVNCDYGINHPRYFEFTPVAGQIGTKTLTYQVYNNRNELIATKSAQLKIVAKPTTNATQKNILTLGDSLYTDGTIVAELNRRLTASSGDGTPLNPTGLNLPNIAFIGRREVAGIHQEASGGWGWRTFATDAVKTIRYNVSGVTQLNLDDTYSITGVAISSTYYMRIIEINVTEGTGNILCEVNGGYVYNIGDIPASGTLNRLTGTGDASVTYGSFTMEDGNPLWNNGAIDFANYSDVYCNSASITAVITNLGINDFRQKSDVDTRIESYIKPLLRAYHTDYPSGKFYIGSIQPPDPTGASKNWYGSTYVYWYYLEKLIELAADAEFSPYVILVDIAGEFDSENSYPYRNAQVNNRNATTEQLGTNMSHPVSEYRKLMSDSYYRCLCANMFV